MKKIFSFKTLCGLLLSLFVALKPLSAQTNVVLPGDFQSELGCPGDWMPECDNTALTYNSGTGLWEGTFNIPAGLWQYKVAIDHTWDENYGDNGVPYGGNIYLDLPVDMAVTFTYNPVTHIVTPSYTNVINAVVIPGSFQSELGCASDWMADCGISGLTYDAVRRVWKGTFKIEAGYWEYKVAINNSWAQNYGAGGISGGDNIPLFLPVACLITFIYDPVTHYVTLKYVTSGVCVESFYDANVNGINDEGIPMPNAQFKVTGAGNTHIQSTGSDGRACFEHLAINNYGAREMVPAGYYATRQNPRPVYLQGEPQTLAFGNVCLGGGGAKCFSFWKGCTARQTLVNLGVLENALSALRSLNLRNQDGSDFDPVNYTQVINWLQHANANNLAYMLSAQVAVLTLNIQAGYVDQNSIIHTPGCSGNALSSVFSFVYDFIYTVDYYLFFNSNITATDINRAYFECLNNKLARTNDNLSFVQPKPCDTKSYSARPSLPETIDMPAPVSAVKIWPNPTNNYFTLQLPESDIAEKVRIRVTDMSGKQLYTVSGNSGKNYRFGDGLKAGIYLVEIVQGEKRSTVKVVKQ